MPEPSSKPTPKAPKLPPLPYMPSADKASSFRLSGGDLVWTVGLAVALIAFTVWVTLGAWADIFRIVQRDEEASHIMLVPAVFACLWWTNRQRLRGASVRWPWAGALVVAAGWGLSFYGQLTAQQVFWHLGAVVCLVGCVVAVVGVTVVLRMWQTFLVLGFLVPIPGSIRQPIALEMQAIAAWLTEQVVFIIGLPIERAGNLLVFNGVEVGIAEACNGMRMIAMLFLVCYLFIFLDKLRPWVMILLLVLSPALAIVCNMIRLVPTVLLYGYASQETADMFHDLLGWAMVGVAYVLLMLMVALMRWLLLPVDRPTSASAAKEEKSDPLGWAKVLVGRPQFGVLVAAGLTLGVLVAAKSQVLTLPTGEEAEPYHAMVRESVEALPRKFDGWVGRDEDIPEAAVTLLKPNVILSRSYRHEATGRQFSLLLVHCSDARDMEGHFPPNCYPSAGWLPRGEAPFAVGLPGLEVTGMAYDFAWQASGSEREMTVMNAIMLPQGVFADGMREVRRLAGSYREHYYGAGQLQLVFDRSWTPETRKRLAARVLEEVQPSMQAILFGRTSFSTSEETEVASVEDRDS
ncbi:MAG: exosortase/archaeosortase family protein [Planctomycetota bacterium]